MWGASTSRCPLWYANNKEWVRRDLLADLEWIVWTLGARKWIVCRDFNEVLESNERNGQRVYSDSGSMTFRETMDNAQLGEVEYVGGPFTLTNREKGEDFVKVRLTRSSWMNNGEGCGRFNYWTLHKGTSKHCSQITCFVPPVKVDNSWLVMEEHQQLVWEAWTCDDKEKIMYKLPQKVRRIKVKTKEWACRLPPISLEITRFVEKLTPQHQNSLVLHKTNHY